MYMYHVRAYPMQLCVYIAIYLHVWQHALRTAIAALSLEIRIHFRKLSDTKMANI